MRLICPVPFLRRAPPRSIAARSTTQAPAGPSTFVGDIVDLDRNMLTIDVRNRFETGDRMELVTPSGNLAFTLDTIIGRDGTRVDAAPGSGHVVRIPLPEGATEQSIGDFALLVRYLPRAA